MRIVSGRRSGYNLPIETLGVLPNFLFGRVVLPKRIMHLRMRLQIEGLIRHHVLKSETGDLLKLP